MPDTLIQRELAELLDINNIANNTGTRSKRITGREQTMLFMDTRSSAGKKAFEIKATQFLSQCQRNGPLMLIAIVVIVLTHIYAESTLLRITIWTGIATISVVFLLIVDFLFTKTKCNRKLYHMLWIRFYAGMLTAASFGSSPFIFRTGTNSINIVLTFLILTCIISLVIISNPIFPEYFITYLICALVPQILFFILNRTTMDAGLGNILILLGCLGPAIFIPKALLMSGIAASEVQNQISLHIEIVNHIKAKQLIEKQALQDDLTGIANRRKFVAHANQEIARAKLDKYCLGIVYLDLNRFKPINDCYGHQFGDEVLKTIAKRLAKQCSDGDLVARMGGDEFCLILSNDTNRQSFECRSKEFQASIRQPVLVQEHQFNVDASSGIAIFPQDGDNLDLLLKIADSRMYSCKRTR